MTFITVFITIILLLTKKEMITMVTMITREEGLPEELLALMDDMKNAQKRANQVRYLPTLNKMISITKEQN